MPLAEAYPSTTSPGSGSPLSYISEETQSIFGKIDLGTIQQSVSKSIPLTFRLKFFTREQHGVLDRVLEAYLSELGLEGIQETLSYCTKELLVNAQKAAAKRVYFQKKGLSINDPDDYKKGMRQFLHYLTESAGEGSREQTETDGGITLTIQSTGGIFIIKVSNKGELTQEEYSRISDRILKARGFSSFYEALNSVRDVTEGAGLGIVILIQFLKRIGVSEEAFTIESAQGSTTACLRIPLSQVQLDKVRALAEVVARDIDSLPHFPENVMVLIAMTKDPKTEVTGIAKKISADPTLTADLLRLVNSAYFMLPRRVVDIVEAVKLIGLKGLQNLLLSYGTQKILGRTYRNMRSLWDHSYQTALYAYLLARSLKRSFSLLDDVYVTGILHDLGLIVVTYLHPALQRKIREFCNKKHIPLKVLEDFSYGLNHADTGGLIASKWNFPDQLVEGIKYHHEPLNAPLRHKDVVFCVYLANMMSNIEKGLVSFEQIETPVLQDFGIKDDAHFNKIHGQFKLVYERQRETLSAQNA
ncbi:MAG: ATP-binding protein [Spirochaetales bacterium]|nr:ATP-binding protein [Spirochaetales bacterium]